MILTGFFCRRGSFSPFAARTQQYVKEQLGQADDKVSQPDLYADHYYSMPY